MPKQGDKKRCPGTLKYRGAPAPDGHPAAQCSVCGHEHSSLEDVGKRCDAILVYTERYGHMDSLFGGGWYYGDKKIIEE